MDLSKIRAAIDNIDDQIIELLKQRNDIAIEVAKYKLANNLPIVDKKRERAKIEKLVSLAQSKNISASLIKQIYSYIINDAVATEQCYIQDKINDHAYNRNSSVAYLGPDGTYSHLACLKYFENYQGNFKLYPTDSFDKIIKLVSDDICEFGILPIENSNSGGINEVLDEISNMPCYIVGEIFYPIDHALIGNSDCVLDEITDIYSHPQPIAQCSKYLNQYFKDVNIHYTKSSSLALEQIKELNDKHAAAIGCKNAACFYDLHDLSSNIANNVKNYTRFIIISKSMFKVDGNMKAKSSIIFTTDKYTPGSLVKVLNEFSKHNINLTKLNSRPYHSKSNIWQEVFFADIEGNIEDPRIIDILESIKEYTSFIKILGCYIDKEINEL